MSRKKILTTSGIVSGCSSRVAKSGSHAHSFVVRGKKFSFFLDDPLHPVIDGDMVRFSYQTRTLLGGSKRQYHAADLETLVIDAPAAAIAQSDETSIESDAGTIYIASNAAMPGLLKIGYTTREIGTRISELSAATGVPNPFKLEWTMPVERSAKEIEGLVHSSLRSKRAGKEFFRLSLETAQDACQSAYLAIHPEGAKRLNEGLAERAAEIARARETRDARLLTWNAEQDEMKRQKAWKQSDDGRWRLKQSTHWLIEDFRPCVARGQTPFHLRLFGRRNPDFLELKISSGSEWVTRGNDQEQVTQWRICAFGWRHGEPCSEEQLRADTWSAALKKAMEFTAGHPARNRRITVTVPNANLRNPRRDAGSKTPVSPEFITEDLDRMELVPEAENGACAPADWQLPLATFDNRHRHGHAFTKRTRRTLHDK